LGLYNIVRIQSACPKCGAKVPAEVQFKYGSTRQNAYAVGSALRWGNDDIGDKALAKVVVDGVAEISCSRCAKPRDVDYYVYVTDNSIEKVELSDGRYDFAAADEPFISLK